MEKVGVDFAARAPPLGSHLGHRPASLVTAASSRRAPWPKGLVWAGAVRGVFTIAYRRSGTRKDLCSPGVVSLAKYTPLPTRESP